MLIYKSTLLAATVIIALLAAVKNRDLFSPVKIYLVFSTFFYVALYFEDVQIETIVSYAFLIQSIAFCLLLERKRGIFSIAVSPVNSARLHKIIWLLSLPSMATMVYFVYDAGGFLPYLLSLAARVETWKGQGHFIVLLNILPTLNLVYFVAIIKDDNTKFTQRIFYGLHFIIFVVVGLLTASRSYIAIPLLGMCVMWAYLLRPPKLRYVLSLAVFLIAFASIYGAVRNNNGEELISDFLENKASDRFENAQMGYGVSPLEIVFSSPEKVILGGLSYLTIFTNFIPRSIWPDKPDTAGIIFTKLYTDDQTGLSYIATGAIAEGVLNFGKTFGPPFGVLINFLVLLCGCVFYNRVISKSTSSGVQVDITLIVAYFYIILAFARFSYGEFTDIFQSLIFFNLLPLYFIKLLLRFKFVL